MLSKFRSGMIWAMAEKQIVELITTADSKRVKDLSAKIVGITKVSWFDILKAVGDVERRYNPRLH